MPARVDLTPKQGGHASMARITVEDCIQRVPNRFHLVQMAAIRAKQIKRGSHSMIAAGENKEVVTALREIAAGFIQPDYPEEEAK
jgi:DNA-directed RNA polymerase subunit omega